MKRNVPLKSTTTLKRGAGLQRHAELSRTPWARIVPAAIPVRKPIKPVSAKRARENRERRAMADRRWPDRREGTVMCYIPGCPLPADDLNEILPRGRGGSITDEENTIPTCRGHNEELTKSPAWAYQAGLLKHAGVCCEGRLVCARYAEGNEAA